MDSVELLETIQSKLGLILLIGFGALFLIYFIFSLGGLRKQIYKWIRMFIFFVFIVLIGDKLLDVAFDTDFTQFGFSVSQLDLPSEITGTTINEVIDNAIIYYAGASDPTVIAVIDGIIGCLFKFLFYTIIAFIFSIVWNFIFWIIWIIFFRYKKKKDASGKRTIKVKKHKFVGGLVGGLRGSFLYCLALVMLLNGPLSLIPEGFSLDDVKIDSNKLNLDEEVTTSDSDESLQLVLDIVNTYKQTPYYKWANDIKVNSTVNGKIWSFEANEVKYNILDEVSGMSDILVEGLNVYSTYTNDQSIDFECVGNILTGLGDSNLVSQLLPSLTGFALSLPEVEEALNNSGVGITVEDLKELDLSNIGKDLNALGSMMNNVEKFVNSIEYVSVEDGNINESKSYEWIRLDKLDQEALDNIIATLSSISTLDSITKVGVKYALNSEEIKGYVEGLEEKLGKVINLTDQIDWVGEVIDAFLDFGFQSVNYITTQYTEIIDQLDLGEKGSGDLGKVGNLITALFSNNIINECFADLMNNVIANNPELAKYSELFNFTTINDKGWQNEFNVILELVKEIKESIDDKNLNIQNEEDKIKLSDLITNFNNFDFTVLANIQTSTILGSDLLSNAAIKLLSTIEEEDNMLHSLAAYVNIPSKYKDENASEWASFEIKDYICQGIKKETENELTYDPVVINDVTYKRYQVISIETYNSLSAENKTYFKAHNKIVGGELYNLLNTVIGTVQDLLSDSDLNITEIIETKTITNYDFIKNINVDTLLGSEIVCSSIAKILCTIDEESNILHSLSDYIYVPSDLKESYESDKWYKNNNGTITGELANMLHGVLDNVNNIIDEVDINEIITNKTIDDLSFVNKLDMEKLMRSEIISSSIANALVNKDTNFLSSFASYIAIPTELNSVEASGWYGDNGELVSILNFVKENASKINLEELKNNDYSFIKDIDLLGIEDSKVLSTSIVNALVNKDTNFLSSLASYIVIPDELNGVNKSGWYEDNGELHTILNAINEIKNEIDFDNILTAEFINKLVTKDANNESKLSKLLDSKVIRYSISKAVYDYGKDYVVLADNTYESITVKEDSLDVINKDELLLIVDSVLKLDVIYDNYKYNDITISEEEYNTLSDSDKVNYKKTLAINTEIFEIIDTLNNTDKDGYTKIDYLVGSNDNIIKGSSILNATVVNLIQKYAGDYVIIPDNILIGETNKTISKDELRSLLVALTEVKLYEEKYKYNDISISETEYNSLSDADKTNYTKTKEFSFSLTLINQLLEKSNSDQTKTKADILLNSNILNATVSKLLADMSNLNSSDTLIIPNYTISTYNNGTNYYQIDKNELVSLVKVAAKLNLVDEDGELNFEVGKLLSTLNTQYVYKDKEVINNVSVDTNKLIVEATNCPILQATISKYILEMDDTISVPDNVKETINETNVIKANELVKLVDAINVLELIDNEGEMKDINLSLINELNVKVNNKTKLDYVLDSDILNATVSKMLVEMDGTIIIDSELYVDNLINNEALRNLINVIIELDIVNDNGDMSDVNLGLVSKMNGSILEDVANSTIMNATISSYIVNNESIVVPIESIDKTITNTLNNQYKVLTKTETINLINAINTLELIENNAIKDVGISLINELTDTKLTTALNSLILKETISDTVANVDAITVPNFTTQVDVNNKTYKSIEKEELIKLIELIQELEIVDGDNVNVGLGIMSKLNGTVLDDFVDSEIMMATVSDIILDNENLIVDNTALNDNVIIETEFRAFVDAINSLNLISNNEIADINTKVSDILNNTNNAGAKVAESIILRGTVGNKVNDTITIPSDGKDGNIISKTELKNLFSSLKKLNVTDFSNVNTDPSVLLAMTNLSELFNSVTVWDKISSTMLENCGNDKSLKAVSNTDTIVNGSVIMNAYDNTINTRLSKAELVAIIDTIKSINPTATTFNISSDDIDGLTSDDGKYTAFANEASKSVIMIYSVADLLGDSINEAVNGSCLASQASKVNTTFDKSYWLSTNTSENGSQLVKVFAGINALKNLNNLANITETQLRTIDNSMVLRGLLNEQLSYYTCINSCIVGSMNYQVGDNIGYSDYASVVLYGQSSNFEAVTYNYEDTNENRTTFIDNYVTLNIGE